jgi:hypothetical protein
LEYLLKLLGDETENVGTRKPWIVVDPLFSSEAVHQKSGNSVHTLPSYCRHPCHLHGPPRWCGTHGYLCSVVFQATTKIYICSVKHKARTLAMQNFPLGHVQGLSKDRRQYGSPWRPWLRRRGHIRSR